MSLPTTGGWCASTAATSCWCGSPARAARARLHLLNYANRPVKGLRVRVRGDYRGGELSAFGQEKPALADYEARAGATEFTVPLIETYAVVDLRK